MFFQVAPSASEPIYRQIVEQVRRQVASGQLQPGDELPSVRAVAQEHAINPMTVSKAYSLLESEGLLERRRGMGMVVAAQRAPGDLRHRLSLLEPVLRSAAQQVVELGLEQRQALDLFSRCLAEHGVGSSVPSGAGADKGRSE
jgi:GntR family transcriptional regulator